MLESVIINDIEYVRVDHLPRWAYHDDEWFDIKIHSDKVIDGAPYNKVPEEPDDSDFEDLVRRMFL